MNYTEDKIDELFKASILREHALVKEYFKTHKLAGRGMVKIPEIDAERAEQKRLYGEFCKLKQKETAKKSKIAN